MSKQAFQGGKPTLANQPAPAEQPLRKANAWWRKQKQKKAKRWICVVSEDEVYVLRKSHNGSACYWVRSDEVPGFDPAAMSANDPAFDAAKR